MNVDHHLHKVGEIKPLRTLRQAFTATTKDREGDHDDKKKREVENNYLAT